MDGAHHVWIDHNDLRHHGSQRERRHGLRPEGVPPLHPRPGGRRARPAQVRRRAPGFHRHDGGCTGGTPKPDGSGTYGTGTYGTGGSTTVAVEADDFQARDLGISNDFDGARNQNVNGHQAVAPRTAADRILLDGVIVSGDQDTLPLDTATKDRTGRVYVTGSCGIGNVDFVFGRATTVIDRSVLTLKKRWDGTSAGYVTAPSTPA